MSASPTEVGHGAFPESMVFQKTWRSYQARILERLGTYLDDRKLHIIAAPGSGKTRRQRVGPVQLIYTRTPGGRKLLLRARVHSLSAAFQKRSERVSCWK